MKTITTFLFSLCFLLTLNAQVQFEIFGKANTSFVKINNSIYPNIIPNGAGTYTISPSDVYRTTTPKIGFNVGGQAFFSFPHKIRIGTGLMWNRFSFDGTIKTTNFNSAGVQKLEYKIEQNLNYLTIPFKLRLGFKDKFNIDIGFSSNTLIHSRHETVERTILDEVSTVVIYPDVPHGVIWTEPVLRDDFGNPILTPQSTPSTPNEVSFFEYFMWGGNLSFSYRIREHLSLDIEYSHLFGNIYSNQFNDDNIIEREGNLGSLSLGLGYRF